MEEGAVTATSFPARRGLKAESNGSALCRWGRMSGTVLDANDCALLAAKRLRWTVKSESSLREDWTGRTTSLARYATLATAAMLVEGSLVGCGGILPASAGLKMLAIMRQRLDVSKGHQ